MNQQKPAHTIVAGNIFSMGTQIIRSPLFQYYTQRNTYRSLLFIYQLHYSNSVYHETLHSVYLLYQTVFIFLRGRLRVVRVNV